MRTYGNKRITPVYGDYRPRERRWNNIKIHGWHNEERTGDSAHEWDDTYNDRVSGEIHGNGDLQSEYYSFERDSEQVSGVSATNLVTNGDFSQGAEGWVNKQGGIISVVSKKLHITGSGTHNYAGTGQTMPTLIAGGKYYIRLAVAVTNEDANFIRAFVDSSHSDKRIPVITNPNQNQTYIMSGVINPIIDVSDLQTYHYYSDAETANGKVMEVQYVLAIDLTAAFGAGNEPTAEQMDAMLAKFPNSWFDGTALLTTDPTYTPNTPSPDYPSPITPYLTAGTYKITMPDGAYELALPSALHGIDGVRDRVVVDYVSKRGWLDGRCDKYVFTGVYPDYVSKNDSTSTSYGYYKRLSNKKLGEFLCTHFKHNPTLKITNTGYGLCHGLYTYAPDVLFFNFYGIVSGSNAELGDSNEANAWLAAQYAAGTPVTVLYQLAEPTQTPLTLTPVDSSTAPELPREFLADATEVSPELPATIISAQPVVQSRGRNLLPYPYDESTKTTNGVTITVNSDGTLTYNGTATGSVNINLFKGKMYLTPGARYYFKDINVQLNGISGNNMSKGYTAQTGDYISLVWRWYSVGTIFDNITIYPMLQKDTGVGINEYKPYRPPSTVTLPELRAIALPETATEWTYIHDGQKYWADTAEWGKFDGVWRWKRTQRCGKWIANGTETGWQMNTASRFQIEMNPPKESYINHHGLVCTHYPISLTDNMSMRSSTSTPSTALFIYFFDNRYSNVNAWKSYLAAEFAAGTPVTVGYILAAPIITYHDDPPLLTYPRYTHVEQIQDGLKAWMDLSCKVVD